MTRSFVWLAISLLEFSRIWLKPYCGAGASGVRGPRRFLVREHRHRLFAAHVLGGFILANAFECSLPDKMICRPCSEADLSYKFWRYPYRGAPCSGWHCFEWTSFDAQLVELIAQQAMCFLRESGAGASCVHEPSVRVIVAQQQSANAVNFIRRQCEAADHEFPAGALHLILTHAPLRPETYVPEARLETMPSACKEQAS